MGKEQNAAEEAAPNYYPHTEVWEDSEVDFDRGVRYREEVRRRSMEVQPVGGK